MVIAVIVYLVFWRNRGGEVGQALVTTSKLLERSDKRISDLELDAAKKNDERNDKIIESNMALSDAFNGVRDLVKELKLYNQTSIGKQNEVIADIQENVETILEGSPLGLELKSEVTRILTDPDISLVVINRKIDSMTQTLAEIKIDLLPCLEAKKVVGDNPAIAETVNQLEIDMRMVKTAIGMGIQEEKGKSKPIPTIAPDEKDAAA
eukprot:GHVR01112348.1.p1 GENE.GHVR01112348.1~~GHVR01112348.1.p1  ORF type:complete len:208 (+),score=21.60 GHVR01112348.1:823-1446(+)